VHIHFYIGGHVGGQTDPIDALYITLWLFVFRFIANFIFLPTLIFGAYMHIHFYIGGQVG